MTPFTFAILSDTHIRPEPVDPQSAYPSDRVQNDRVRRAIEMIRRRSPSFVIHLGDLTHTLPALPNHGAALAWARELLAELPCPLHVAPGNHDVGDKADSMATAPRVDETSHELFEAVFGPSWHAFDHQGCRFILLDGCLLGSGIERERRMRDFVQQAVAGCERAFLFLHYPPYIQRPDEPSHYDNLSPKARAWLLGLLEHNPIEAIFAGHAHTFFQNRLQETDLYCLPSTAFTRPEYAELFPVDPAPENGRDDSDKLGFFLVHVTEEGHEVELVRCASPSEPFEAPASPSPLGIWLRSGVREVELPHGDLDAFTRKKARNDQPLLLMGELGISRLRVPLGDLKDPSFTGRLRELGPRSPRLLVASLGFPDEKRRDLLRRRTPFTEGWQIFIPEEQWGDLERSLRRVRVPLALSLLPQERPDSSGYFSHFPNPGFRPDSPLLATLKSVPRSVRWLVFRASASDDLERYVAAARDVALKLGLRTLIHFSLSHGSETRRDMDEQELSRMVARIALLAHKYQDLDCYLDTFEDKDRGYHPRLGLVDRRWNPRPAARVLRRLGNLLEKHVPEEFSLHPEGPGPFLDLDSGRWMEEPPVGPALRKIT